MANSVIGRDLAVDLGSTSTRVYVRGRGVALDEPSVVTLGATSDDVVAVGERAKAMVGRTPDHLRTVRPVSEGLVVDVSTTEQMLRHFIAQVHRRRYFAKPRLVVTVPTGLDAARQRAVKAVGYAAGARHVALVEAPMAAAIGAGLPVHEPSGNLVVDLGGGTTVAAVIALGGVVTSRTSRVAGGRLDRALVAWLAGEHALAVGDHTAEQVKIALGSAYPLPTELEADVRGRDLGHHRGPERGTGLPRVTTLFSTEVRRALEPTVMEIVALVRETLDQTPPELASDIIDRGIVLTGGGAGLRGLDELLRVEVGLPVHVADDPATAVVRGAGECVEELEALRAVLVPADGADVPAFDEKRPA